MKNSSTRSKLILLVVVSALPALALTLYSALEERALNLAGIALATILLLLGAWYGTEVFVLILRRTKTSVPYHAPRRSRIVASAMPARLRARSSSALHRVRASAGSAETTTRRISLLRVLKFFIPVPCGILGLAASNMLPRGRIDPQPEERKVNAVSKLRDSIRARYLKVDTATVADVLDVLGLPDQGLAPGFAPYPSNA